MSDFFNTSTEQKIPGFTLILIRNIYATCAIIEEEFYLSLLAFVTDSYWLNSPKIWFGKFHSATGK